MWHCAVMAATFEAGLDRPDAIVERAKAALRLVDGRRAELTDELDILTGGTSEIADNVGHERALAV